MPSSLNWISNNSHSPTNSVFSAKRKASFGSCRLKVTSARIILAFTLNVFSSPISPEGMSMATTIAGEELMYFTTAANPPLNGLFRPEPNNPSITRWSGVRAGGTNWVLISWNFTSSIISTSSLLVWQSGESSPLVLKRNTSILYPFSAIMRATARASPPLFPGPAKIVTGVSVFHLSVMAFVNTVAARSIRSIDVIGSFSMV